ncbi:hypothetical protein KIL84_001230 [Mauremys mutica]|uniref:Uncharacterized protein n=1 Tax=Mauremys mutica TaxID=74926 RepID=A0A9D3X056_9SAUR|nr:hypothetical protein KIL84_001230 [Mauremys mutica]
MPHLNFTTSIATIPALKSLQYLCYFFTLLNSAGRSKQFLHHSTLSGAMFPKGDSNPTTEATGERLYSSQHTEYGKQTFALTNKKVFARIFQTTNQVHRLHHKPSKADNHCVL